MNKIRVCPICAHDKRESLYIQKYAEHFRHNIVSCLFCGFVYVSNIPPQEYFNAYYKDQSKYNGTRKHEMHDKFTYKTIEYILKKYVKNKASILDVGCATGKLLNFIKTEGYKNVSGVDPVPNCREIAKREYNISVTTSTLENFTTSEKYDLIIFSQVLEHLVSIDDAIIKAHLLLKENGLIFIGVPDSEHFHKRFTEPFGEFSTEHINFFTYKSLLRLLGKFENIFIRSDNQNLLSVWKKMNIESVNIHKYICKSQAKMKNLIETINKLPKNTIVWGGGALTQRLLETTSLKHKVFKFVDSNMNLIGKKIEGIDTISPNELIKYKNTVLISSFGFKDEIIREIKKRKLNNKIITFK